MPGDITTLDPLARPPDLVRNTYKKYQKLKPPLLDQDEDLIDLSRGLSELQKKEMKVVRHYLAEELQEIFHRFEQIDPVRNNLSLQRPSIETAAPVPVYEHVGCAGLYVVPSLIPESAQHALLSRLLHRDLSNPLHLTNIHMHYDLTYPPGSSSFFSLPLDSESPCLPKDASTHSPLSVQSLLDRKLRWVTLGGQYDWTMKAYPNAPPPPFPDDIAEMLHRLLPDMRAEAAICNLYSPGDTLSLHRDVSEFCDAPLVSISIGCDAVFVVKSSDEDGDGESGKPLVIRLHSGDAVYMSGSSRFAWHGVPQIIPGTCPEALADWPASLSQSGDSATRCERDAFDHWKGWMRRKRINLNVRQMKA